MARVNVKREEGKGLGWEASGRMEREMRFPGTVSLCERVDVADVCTWGQRWDVKD